MSMPVTIIMFAIVFMFWSTESWSFDRTEIIKVRQDVMTEQTISMDVLKKSFSPNKFTLRKGVPVKWVINVKESNECNEAIVIPQYGLEIKLQLGEQIIEFTPTESGVVPWSCWMGMIPGTFIVIDDNESKR